MADGYAAGPDPREGLFEFGSFMGLRNNVSPEQFLPEDLQVALNLDIDDGLGIARRKGYSAPVTAAVDRDLWASGPVCLGVGSNALKLVNPDWSTVTLRSGLTPAQPLSYAVVGDRIFYANGVELGCIQGGVHRTWGITPPGLPLATATAGTMRPGKYQYAVTYLRSDGQESGAGLAGTIELTTMGGIELSSVPVSADPTAAYKAIYVSTVGGEVLYRSGTIANATTTFVVRETRMNASPLITQFLTPPPAGEHIGYWRGWLIVAKGARLYPSEAYAPELFDIRKAVPLSDRITMVAPVRDGIWVGTASQIGWIAGESPETWAFRVVAEYGSIPGVLAYGDSELIGDGSAAGEQVAFFATTRGLCVGRPGGTFSNLTAARFAYPIQERGAAVVRRHRGTVQMVATMTGAQVTGNVAA